VHSHSALLVPDTCTDRAYAYYGTACACNCARARAGRRDPDQPESGPGMVGAQQGCRLRWVLVLGTLWQSFFSTGIVYGWAGLLLLLKDGGVYVL
jgi:hypothetical protein